MTERARVRRAACFFGFHGARASRGYQLGDPTWCVRCGRTWRSTYDGINAGWRRDRGLSYGNTKGKDQ